MVRVVRTLGESGRDSLRTSRQCPALFWPMTCRYTGKGKDESRALRKGWALHWSHPHLKCGTLG